MVRLCAPGHAPTLERQHFIRVQPERAWRSALVWERVHSDLGFVSEQTTELRFRTAGNRRKRGDIRSFVTGARLGVNIEQFYQMPMDVEWALAGGRFFIVQARPITALPPEWTLPEPKALYTRGSLAEHTPSPVTPLFAMLGLEIANLATDRIWERFIGEGASNLFPGEGAYVALNGYVYLGFRLGGKNTVKVTRVFVSNLGSLFRGSVARWQAARQELAAVVEEWERKPVEALAPSQLLQGVCAVFGAACRYFTEIQTTLPAAATSEALFTRLYDSLIRRKGDPTATSFLFGFETAALQAEKSLFDIAEWMRASPALADYALQTPTEKLETDFRRETAPEALPAGLWAEWRSRFQRHLDEFGRATYEFDFANPTPQETPGPMLDAIKAYLAGKAEDPYRRQREASEKREQATKAVLERVGWPRKGLFLKLLRWARDTGPMRENSIFDMGMGHPMQHPRRAAGGDHRPSAPRRAPCPPAARRASSAPPHRRSATARASVGAAARGAPGYR
jgi:pyruvate,water dikinase